MNIVAGKWHDRFLLVPIEPVSARTKRSVVLKIFREASIVWTCLSVHQSSMAAVELISYTKARWWQKKKKKKKVRICHSTYQEVFRVISPSREDAALQ